MINWRYYTKIVRAWLASGAAATPLQAFEFAARTLAGLVHLDLDSPLGQLALSVLEGAIVGPQQHPEMTTPDGQHFFAGPVVTPEHAVAVALAAAAAHPGPIPPDPKTNTGS